MTEDEFWGRPQQPMIELCRQCDGLGDDDDLLWPTKCDHCGGTGFEPDDDEYPDAEVIEIYPDGPDPQQSRR